MTQSTSTLLPGRNDVRLLSERERLARNNGARSTTALRKCCALDGTHERENTRATAASCHAFRFPFMTGACEEVRDVSHARTRARTMNGFSLTP